MGIADGANEVEKVKAIQKERLANGLEVVKGAKTAAFFGTTGKAAMQQSGAGVQDLGDVASDLYDAAFSMGDLGTDISEVAGGLGDWDAYGDDLDLDDDGTAEYDNSGDDVPPDLYNADVSVVTSLLLSLPSSLLLSSLLLSMLLSPTLFGTLPPNTLSSLPSGSSSRPTTLSHRF